MSKTKRKFLKLLQVKSITFVLALQNLVSVAKVSAPLVFAEGKEYNKRRSFGGGGISLN